MSTAANPRQIVIRLIFISMAVVMLLRLFFLQIIESKYKVMANDIAIFRKVVYPPRGAILDRKMRPMLYNERVYDLMVTPSDVSKSMDTVAFCNALGIDVPAFIKLVNRATVKTGPRRKGVFIEQLSQEQSARFQENMYNFPGFEMAERFIRTYPKPIAALMLGYIGEVSPDMLKKERYASYQQGDYTGLNGLERSYEDVLRGQRGVHFLERDKFNRPRDPYKGGILDTPEIAGKNLELYLDAELQEYAEKLMQNKLGSVVAIDPQTGGILTMVSAPSYDPNLLKGAEKTRNYSKLYKDATHPLLNRATQATYQPGSTMKPMTGLIALDVGAITPSFGYPCRGGYYACSKRIGCTHTDAGHAANLRLALAHSCNSYFVHVFRMTVDSKKFGDVKKGVQKWHEYCSNFGFGHPTGVDIPFEGKGQLPDSNTYNKMYNGAWNSCTMLYVGMGQGEIALTPLQITNAMCIIANKGYYYTPHFVKKIGNNPKDDLLKPYLEKHVVLHIPDTTFNIIHQGMQDVVDHGTGTVAKLEGINICAKTGTVENKAVVNGEAMKMKDHSVFVAFAPRENPKIAIAVVVENAGFGASWAGPIASLIIEKYLRDSVSSKRKYLEEKMYGANLINRYTAEIDSAQRRRDEARRIRLTEQKKLNDSLAYDKKRLQAERFFRKYYFNNSKK
ncbi:MAG: penicillin-binding protein 2 [Bacteroidetes bacterium]|nr:penicillin-binding protein 2 [Bacteroidota bacterium]